MRRTARYTRLPFRDDLPPRNGKTEPNGRRTTFVLRGIMKHRRIWFVAVTSVVAAAFWVVAWAPLGLWTAMLVHAIRASRFLHRWPSYAQPDPNDLPPFLLNQRIEACVGYALVFCGAGALTYVTRSLKPARRLIASMIGIVLLWALAWVLAWLDPGGVVEWYVD
jgi:hypothetical protein